MPFFLDTGPIFARIKPGYDPHKRKCEVFFSNYPFEYHDYYSHIDIVEKELQNLLQKKGYNIDIFKSERIKRNALKQWKIIKEYIFDIDRRNHALFPQIFQDLLNYLNQLPCDGKSILIKDHDAILLSNALIFSEENSGRVVEFVTVDRKDLSDNFSDLKTIGKVHLPNIDNFCIKPI